MKIGKIKFPIFSGTRCLMMPYIQGNADSVPLNFRQGYEEILNELYFAKGEIGFLTIDESEAVKGQPHRGARAKFGRALHTEAGLHPNKVYGWGGSPACWGGSTNVILERDTQIFLANNVDNSCALWEKDCENTSLDGDIGDKATEYPYEEAVYMQAGEVHRIGILTPHESMPIKNNVNRQFLRIISSGVHGREPYFTENPLLKVA